MYRLFGVTSATVAFLATTLYLLCGTSIVPGHTSLPLGTLLGLFESWVADKILNGVSETTIAENPPSSNSWSVLEHLGGYSPWIPKRHGIVEGGSQPSDGCYIDQVHMLSRHAERYPTLVPGIGMLELYQRLQKTNVTLQGDLAFANGWQFFTTEPAEDFESLVSTGDYAGTLEAFATGVKLRTRYKSRLDVALGKGYTSFWASDSKRVIDSAQYFATGFFGINWRDLASLRIIPETPDRGADTLTPGRTCRRYRDDDDEYGHAYGARMMNAFRGTYEPAIVQRLAEQNPEFRLTEDEVFLAQQICGFETIAKGWSPWCDVFTQEEWLKFEYARDIIHYYRTGPGNPYSGAMGWLWLNATTTLLQQGPSIGTLFLSFVHDGDVIPMLNALDVLPQTPELPVAYLLDDRTWRTSEVVPMGGRVIFERLMCPAPSDCWSNAPLYPNHVYCEEKPDNAYARVNINDGIVAIPGCADGPGSSCPLESFTERVRKRSVKFGRFGKVCGLRDDAAQEITFLHQ